MSTSALAKGGRIGVAFVKRIRKKWSNGAFFTNERYTRSAQYHASPKGHMRKGRGRVGGNSSCDAHHARSRTAHTLTQTPWRLLFFIWRGRSLSLSFSQEPNRPTHHTYVSQSELPHQNRHFSVKSFFFPPPHTILDTFN